MDQHSENDYENVASGNIVETSVSKGPLNYQNYGNDYENVTLNQYIKESSGPAHHSARRACILVAVGLAALCVLQLILNVYLSVVAYSISGENLLQIARCDNLTKEKDELQTSYDNLTEERDQLQTSSTTVTKERNRVQNIYNNLTKVQNQLQTNYNNLVKERTQLQTILNNLTKERDQLQTSYHTLMNQMCPQDWKKSGCSCYYISPVKKTWHVSRQDCLDRKADLVIINSREEQAFIKSLNQRVWIGLTDGDVEGTWRWVDGTQMTTNYWNKDEPNGGKLENCGENKITNIDPVMAWNDESCDSLNYFICERLT